MTSASPPPPSLSTSSPSPPPPPSTDSPAALEFLSELRAHGEIAISSYTILGAVGKGKFAVVYKAKNALGVTFALKKVQIFDSMTAASREKCLREIKLLEGLSHSHIIKYEDSFIDNTTNDLVIVLQWANGGDLKKLIKKRKAEKDSGSPPSAYQFDENFIWQICYEMCSALAYMKTQRVCHRDMKPANVMLTAPTSSSPCHVLLGDLGLSRYFNTETIEAFSKVGTPLYIAPEVLIGSGYDYSADSWSVGTIIYEMITLQSPFKPKEEGVNLYQLFHNIKGGIYDKIQEGQGYSKELIEVVESLIQTDPTKRPTMEEIAKKSEKYVPLEKRVKGGERPQSGRPLSAAKLLTEATRTKPNKDKEKGVSSTIVANEIIKEKGKPLEPIARQPSSNKNIYITPADNNNNNNNKINSVETYSPPIPTSLNVNVNGKDTPRSTLESERARLRALKEEKEKERERENKEKEKSKGEMLSPHSLSVTSPTSLSSSSSSSSSPSPSPLLDLSPDILSDEISSRLSLMDVQRLFCAPLEFPPFHSFYFTQKALTPNPHIQFVYFSYLVLWLLLHCSESVAHSLEILIENEYQRETLRDEIYTMNGKQRANIFNETWKVMGKLGISPPSPSPPSDLSLGYGTSCLYLLYTILHHVFTHHLLTPPLFPRYISINEETLSTPLTRAMKITKENAKIIRKDFSLPEPIYVNVEMVVQRIGEKGQKQGGEGGDMDIEDEVNMDILDGDGEEEKEVREKEHPNDNSHRDDHGDRSSSLFHSPLDLLTPSQQEEKRTQWMIEVERVQNHYKSKTKSSSSSPYSSTSFSSVSHRHELAQKHVNHLSDILKNTSFLSDLAKKTQNLQKFIEKVQLAENRINDKVRNGSGKELIEEMIHMKKDVMDAQIQYDSLSQLLTSRQNSLKDFEERVSEVSHQMQKWQDDHHNPSFHSLKMKKLKSIIGEIRRECSQMEVKSMIIMQQLTSQMARNSQRDDAQKRKSNAKNHDKSIFFWED